MFDRFHACLVTRMRDVDEHANPIHFVDNHSTKTAQATLTHLVTAVRNEVFLVICQQHVTNAQFVIGFDKIQVATYWQRTLEMKADSQFSRAFGEDNIFRSFDQHAHVGLILEESPAFSESRERLRNIRFVIHYREGYVGKACIAEKSRERKSPDGVSWSKKWESHVANDTFPNNFRPLIQVRHIVLLS